MIYLFFLLNILRLFVYKVRYGRRYTSSLWERIHSKATLRCYQLGQFQLGKNIEISDYCDFLVFDKAKIIIGDHTYFNKFCMISCHSGVEIGKDCLFGPGVKIFDNDHLFTKDKGVSCSLKSSPISIGNHCWIASDVIILKGSKIGDNCVIGAGCVIKGDIPPYSLVKQQRELEIVPIKE